MSRTDAVEGEPMKDPEVWLVQGEPPAYTSANSNARDASLRPRSMAPTHRRCACCGEVAIAFMRGVCLDCLCDPERDLDADDEDARQHERDHRGGI